MMFARTTRTAGFASASRLLPMTRHCLAALLSTPSLSGAQTRFPGATQQQPRRQYVSEVNGEPVDLRKQFAKGKSRVGSTGHDNTYASRYDAIFSATTTTTPPPPPQCTDEQLTASPLLATSPRHSFLLAIEAATPRDEWPPRMEQGDDVYAAVLAACKREERNRQLILQSLSGSSSSSSSSSFSRSSSPRRTVAKVLSYEAAPAATKASSSLSSSSSSLSRTIIIHPLAVAFVSVTASHAPALVAAVYAFFDAADATAAVANDATTSTSLSTTAFVDFVAAQPLDSPPLPPLRRLAPSLHLLTCAHGTRDFRCFAG
jgi:hypothetical protein